MDERPLSLWCWTSGFFLRHKNHWSRSWFVIRFFSAASEHSDHTIRSQMTKNISQIRLTNAFSGDGETGFKDMSADGYVLWAEAEAPQLEYFWKDLQQRKKR